MESFLRQSFVTEPFLTLESTMPTNRRHFLHQVGGGTSMAWLRELGFWRSDLGIGDALRNDTPNPLDFGGSEVVGSFNASTFPRN